MSSARENMVERYLDGAMDAAEEREFIERMSSDRSLQRLVEADRALMSGVRKEIASLPAGTMEPGASLLAKLAATPPTAAAVTGGTIGGALFASGTVKVLVAAVGVAGIAVGAFLIAPLMRQEPPAANVPARRITSPPALIPPPPSTAPADHPTPETPADAHGPGASATSRRSEREVQSAKATTSRGGVEHAKPAVGKPAKATGADLLDEQLSGKPTVFRNDSVKVKVQRGSHPK